MHFDFAKAASEIADTLVSVSGGPLTTREDGVKFVEAYLRELKWQVDELRQKKEALQGELATSRDIIGLLRAQLRMLGHIPCVVETAEVGDAEYKMRAAVRGN